MILLQTGSACGTEKHIHDKSFIAFLLMTSGGMRRAWYFAFQAPAACLKGKIWYPEAARTKDEDGFQVERHKEMPDLKLQILDFHSI
jgi:hypothetical protein